MIGGKTFDLTTANGDSAQGDVWSLVTEGVTLAKGANILQFASTDVNTPYGAVVGGVSLTAVPEPSTWAMMLIGFAGLGIAGYRVSRKAVSIAA